MKQCILFSYFVYSFLLFNSCNKNTNANSILNFQIVNRVNNSPIELGKKYWLKNNDSIVIERLDYYVSEISTSNGSHTNSSNTLFLINEDNQKIAVTNLNSLTSMTALTMNLSLTSEQNNSNPSSFSNSNPLSSIKNMYWSDWTKYRYIVFEGRIISNGQNKTFTYHTGLEYKTAVVASGNLTLSSENKIYLNIDKIFYPTSGNNLNQDTELVSHSEVSQHSITTKFVQNFGNAFSF